MSSLSDTNGAGCVVLIISGGILGVLWAMMIEIGDVREEIENLGRILEEKDETHAAVAACRLECSDADGWSVIVRPSEDETVCVCGPVRIEPVGSP